MPTTSSNESNNDDELGDFLTDQPSASTSVSAPAWHVLLESQEIHRHLNAGSDREHLLLDFEARLPQDRLDIRRDQLHSPESVASLSALAHSQAHQLAIDHVVPQDIDVLPRVWPHTVHGVIPSSGSGILPLRHNFQDPTVSIGGDTTLADPFHPLSVRGPLPANSPLPFHLWLSDQDSFGPLSVRPIYHEIWWPSSPRLPPGPTPWLCVRWFILPQENLSPHIDENWTSSQIQIIKELWDRTRPWHQYRKNLHGINFHVLERYVTSNFAATARYSRACLEFYIQRLTTPDEPNVVCHTHVFQNSHPSTCRIITLGDNDELIHYERPNLCRPASYRAWCERVCVHDQATGSD